MFSCHSRYCFACKTQSYIRKGVCANPNCVLARGDIEGHQTFFLCQTQAQAMQNMSPTCFLGDLCSTSWSFEPNLMCLKASFQVVLFKKWCPSSRTPRSGGPQESRRSATRARSARSGGPESRGGPHLLETQVPPPVQQARLQPSSRLQVFKQVSELIHLLYKFRLAILFCYKATGS